MSEYQQLLINHESSGFSENNIRPTSNYGLVFEYEEDIKVGKRHEEKLDSILYEIGFGKFQYLMLLLCGFGWLADNLWLQVVILLLPRIQKHYSLNDVQIGFPNSALFIGMMLGSLFWGGHSDIHGRRDAFHWTLTITTIGGLLCGFTPNFELLNLFLIILGFGVGGAVPVDSSIILEFLPTKYHYIVTSLSVFVNLGGVLASYFAYIILPTYSCPEATSPIPTLPCDVNVSNNGWRYVFISLSIVNGLMAFWRICLFKLPESPHYLLSNNKFQRVADTLNQVAEYNGLSTRFTVNDLIPTRKNAEMEEYCEESEESQFGLEQEPHSFNNNQSNSTSANKFTFLESGVKTHWLLKLLGFDWNLVYNLFQPYYRLSTVLMWTIWTLMALSYNLFTIFLPKYLEMKGQKEGSGSMSDVYWSYLIYSLWGIPGSLVGGWLVDTKLGRKGTLALSILLDAFAQMGFILFQSLTLVTISSSAASFLITLMYAVLYSYTPEIFDPRLRSTACGIAVSLSRLLAIISPMLTSVLYSIRVWSPLEISTILLVILVILTLMLPIETRGKVDE